MTSKRNVLGAGLMALALGLPALASAEQAPSELCDGAKTEKAPTTDQRAEQNADKSQKKQDEKRDGKTADKTEQNGKTS